MDRLIACALSALLTLVASAGAADAPAPRTLSAQAHFERGLALSERGDLELALRSFRASYDLQPSPNSSLMIARTLRELGRPAEAAQQLEAAAREARLLRSEQPRFAPTAEAAERELAALRPSLGTVVLTLDGPADGAVVRVGSRVVAAEQLGLPLFVEPGAHRVTVRRADGPILASRELEVVEGREVRLGLRVPAASPASPALASESGGGVDAIAVAGGTLLALSALGWAGVVAFGVMASELHDELDAACGGPCPAERADDVARGRTYQDLANAGIAVGSTLAIAGIVLLIVSVTQRGETSEVTLGPGGVQLRF